MSGTDFKASSVERIIKGKIIIERVKEPAKIEYPHPKNVTKKSIPNNPYKIEGIPDKVSVAIRITATNLLLRLAYSVKYMAEKIPRGTVIKRESNVIIIVDINAGIKDTFSLVYLKENKDGFKYGTPLMRINPTIVIKALTVRKAAVPTIIFAIYSNLS